MKILMLTPYVTLKGHAEFMRNQTGFGYMVYDIARGVAKTEHVDVLASNSQGRAFVVDKVHFLERSWWLFFKHIWKNLPINGLWRQWQKYRMSNGSFARLCYYWLASGYYRSVICNGHYDIVHIHGCGFNTDLWMDLCKQCRQKYIVTLHGLNSFSDTVRLEPAGKQNERDFLKRAVNGEFPITVISTGMKRLIEKTYGIQDCHNITVVCNSFDFSVSTNSINVREKYSIPVDAKVILYVGNISYNKNQAQMVRAYALLPEEMRRQTWVLFCGGGDDERLNEAIANCAEMEHLVLCGVVDKASMPDYYNASDGVALLSYSEGFGLSLAEGMYFGLPSTTFTDLSAFVDLYEPESMVAIKSRQDDDVAAALQTLLNTSWNRDVIRHLSHKFSLETMADNYISVYYKIIQGIPQ